ncbi:TPA: head decoration protein [Raoultella planticola]|uniref:head decoration protein n=1 Tax=Raoultella planticola TaxID=575 RepID=UPI000C1B31B7|nr:head decoration protein [Raoultella planticola]PIM81952.1 head decoration protein [Raoultella planticola]HAT1631590.1 head decoration protein [Raoultella planticola]
MTVNQVGQNAWVPGVQHDTFIPDQLLSGPLQVVSDTITVLTASTALYKRGTVLGVVTASGKYTLSVATATDGSQVPKAILADDVNATAADVLAGVYLMAEVNQNRITFDPSWTLSTLKTALRPFGIFLRDSVQAPAS